MKMIRIPEPLAWRIDAQTLLHFGTYRVPEDVSEEVAQTAIDAGVAEEVVVEDTPRRAARRAKAPQHDPSE